MRRGAPQSHCHFCSWHCRTQVLWELQEAVQLISISLCKGCSQSSVVAQKWSLLPSSPEVCLLPQIIQPDLESTREPSCISTRVLFRLLLFKSFFSLSFPSYHAACPTGTTLMPENRLDNTFYEQAKRGLKPFCTRLPANQQQGQGQSQGPRSPSHTFSSALPSITGRFEERHNSISLESGGRNRESKEGGLNGKEFTNTTGTRIFLLQ